MSRPQSAAVSRPLARLALAALALCACGAPDTTRDARDAFVRFRSAVAGGDRDALRDLLTAESFPAIDEVLGAAGPRSNRELEIATVRPRGSGRVDLTLVETDGDAERSVCVVVREGGRWRIDLVESAIATHGTTAGAGFDLRPGADPAVIEDAVMRHGAGIR